MDTAADSSMGTATSCPRVSALSGLKVSRCGSAGPRCEPGSTRMQPLSGVAGLRATQAVSTSIGASPQ